MKPAYIEWCNANEYRRYPLRSGSTADLPDTVISDLGISTPLSAADSLYVSDVRVSEHVFVVCISVGVGPVLIGSYAMRDVVTARALPMTSLAAGFSGWLTPGTGVRAAPGVYRYTTVEEAGVDPDVLRFVPEPPVRSVSAEGADDVLTGVVRLAGAGPLSVRSVPGEPGLIELSLDPRVCEDYLPRDQDKRIPIRDVGGVTADSDGFITLRIG